MSEETKAAFESMRFYKFYPVQSPDAPDVSNVKVGLQAFDYNLFSLVKSVYSSIIGFQMVSA